MFVFQMFSWLFDVWSWKFFWSKVFSWKFWKKKVFFSWHQGSLGTTSNEQKSDKKQQNKNMGADWPENFCLNTKFCHQKIWGHVATLFSDFCIYNSLHTTKKLHKCWKTAIVFLCEVGCKYKKSINDVTTCPKMFLVTKYIILCWEKNFPVNRPNTPPKPIFLCCWFFSDFYWFEVVPRRCQEKKCFWNSNPEYLPKKFWATYVQQ